MQHIRDKKGRIISSICETEEERAHYKRLFAPNGTKKFIDIQRERAAVVLNLVLEAYNASTIPYRDPSEPSFSYVVHDETWPARMDEAIKNHLDHESIGSFVGLTIASHGISSQAAKGSRRHRETRQMKGEVLAWMDKHAHQFKSMDSTAQHIAERVAPISFRTARAWVSEWKKLRSTGRL